MNAPLSRVKRNNSVCPFLNAKAAVAVTRWPAGVIDQTRNGPPRSASVSMRSSPSGPLMTVSPLTQYALLAPCWKYSNSRSQPELIAREPFLTDHHARTVSSYKGLSMVSTVAPSEDTKNSEPSMSNPAWMVAEMVSLTPGIECPPVLTWMPLAGELIHAEVWMGDV